MRMGGILDGVRRRRKAYGVRGGSCGTIPDVSEPTAPVPAAAATTVVLLRPRTSEGGPTFETLLLERAPTSSFLAGAHVFPGGRVDPEDRDPAWRSCCDGLDDIAARLAPVLSPAEAVAHAIAGIREVFEETGLFLGRASVSEAELEVVRRDLIHRQITFKDWCLASGARLSLGALLPWAHWITPEAERKRFDTWFLLAVVARDARVSVIPGEVVTGAWHSPQAALAAHDEDRLVLAPPTVRTLEEFEGHVDLDALCAASRTRTLAAILPRLIQSPHGPVIVLPGDPDYGPTPGPALPGSTRFVRRGKRWVATSAI